MKYLLMIYGNQEKWAPPGRGLAGGDRQAGRLQRKYAATGELLGAYGLADAAAAKLVAQGRRRPSPTARTWKRRSTWPSFYLVDVESEERAYEIAAEMPWADVEPIEVWPILHEAVADL